MGYKKIIYASGIVTVSLTTFIAFVNYNEWYHIVILKEADAYHFGSEGPSPYYYQTPALYATVIFTWGTLFLFNLIYVIWSMLKGKSRATMIGFGVSIIMFFVMFLRGQIGIE
jgi:hypothetical protein